MKWGIMSTGNIAHQFAAALKLAGQDLIAVSSRTQESADGFAGEFGLAKAYGNHADLAADGEVGLVYVAAPNLMHYELVKLCLENGKHVLCEKPLTTSYEESRQLYALAEEKHLFLLEGFWVAFLPILAPLREDLAALGEITGIDLQYGFISSGPRRLTKLKPELGGGALMDIGIYCLGFLYLVKGECPHYDRGTVEYCEYGTDEACEMDLSWRGGTKAHAKLSVKEVMDRIAVIRGTRGRIETPDFQHLEQYTLYLDGAEPKEVSLSKGNSAFEEEIREAIRCVESGQITSPRYTSRMSLELIRLMDEIRADWKQA